MPTISAHIDKSLKDKLTSKTKKEDKSISDLVKEALNYLDLDKEESNKVNEQSKTKDEREEITPLLNELNDRVREIEDVLIELTKMEVESGKIQVKLGEAFLKWCRGQEKERVRWMQSQDANRTYLHNLTIEALEKTTSENLNLYKGHHPNLHK